MQSENNEEWLDAISRWLVSAGFGRVDRSSGNSAEGVNIQFKGEACEVIVGRERLQWYIGVAPRGGDPVMLPKIWSCYLDGFEPDASSVEPLQSQIDFVYSRLGEVAEAVERDPEVGNKLLAMNRRLMMARLRLGPDMKRIEPDS